MMEKRNYVTTGRTVETLDDLADEVAALFGSEKKASNDFEKKASAEDEKSDSAE